VGVVVALVGSLDLRFRLAQGFRAPNLYDLTNIGPVPGGIVVPNPDARPERSLTYEAGVRLAHPAAVVDLVAYRTGIDGFINRAPSSFQGDTLLDGERVFRGLNLGEARLWGIEAEAVRRVGPVEARTTLLYTYGEQTLADGTVEPMAKIPPLGGSVQVRWPNTRWWIAYQLTWATRQNRLAGRDLVDSRIEPGGTAGYAVHGIRGGVALATGISASFGFENLANALYRAHASGIDAPGRHIWVGMALLGGL
jgi:outer membrane receptor protein involved in Fe transport